MKDRDEINLVRAEVEEQLLKLPGVTGVDVGYKYIGGQKTDILAIRVYVKLKKDVSPEHTIPREIKGVPTDVIQRSFKLHSS